MEQIAQVRPAAPALILVDSSFAPLSYNTEAIRILLYPKDPALGQAPAKDMEGSLHPLLSALRFQGKTLPSFFQSGRRRYGVRMFSLANHEAGVSQSDAPHAAYALLLERTERKQVDLSRVAAQYRLTAREQQTLSFLLEGMTSKEIANSMSISPHTVKAFLRLVMGKMQVTTRSGIIGKMVRVNP